MTDTNPWRPAGAEHTDWRDHAARGGLDPDLFFPVSTSGASLTEIEAARRVCQRCAVRRRLRKKLPGACRMLA
jgi:Transcription factor WhiB